MKLKVGDIVLIGGDTLYVVEKVKRCFDPAAHWDYGCRALFSSGGPHRIVCTNGKELWHRVGHIDDFDPPA
jgi:hypothetical protein